MDLKGLFRTKSVHHILTEAANHQQGNSAMKRNLTVYDLTGLGIAAVIGAGIFSTIGNAATHGGPAVSVLFLFTAVACGFSALCYAQFASAIPISGSAYTYAYASFGELVAWIIGWDLIMEYAIGNIAVAISWSDYFTSLLGGIGIHFPEYMCIDYLSAFRGYHQALTELAHGATVSGLPSLVQDAYHAWINAPVIGGVHLIADIPAFCIVVFISVLVYVGIYETKIASNIMVLLKIAILLLIIGVGAFFVDTKNWTPFAPNGIGGVLRGVSGVFFAYIGFDAISTTAEECRNPRRDLPRAILMALAITTVLYILISLVLTGMVPFSELGVGDPLAFAFERLHLTKLSGIIAISAVIAMASVLLVFQVGQPRIWMSMSRDGLLPKAFSRINPRFKTPAFATVVAGFLVAIPSLFLNLVEVTDLTSIGTLFAFVLVSGGVLILDGKERSEEEKAAKSFRVPYFSSRYLLPLIWLIVGLVWYLSEKYSSSSAAPLPVSPFSEGWVFVVDHVPILMFTVIAIAITFLAIWKKLSLIPVMGLLTNLYLMAQLGITNWMRFIIWLVIGLAIYAAYGFWHSRIRRSTKVEGRS
jgi:basic amino acid/polyamine antiporter, APA family